MSYFQFRKCLAAAKFLFLIALTSGFSNVISAEPILYGVDASTDQLIVIDTTTGVGTAVGPLGFVDVTGIAYDSSSGTLYGIDKATSQLITINPETGGGTVVGPLGIKGVESLDYDVLTDTLYSSTGGSDQLIRINKITGLASIIGPLNFPFVAALTLDVSTNTLYGVNSGIDYSILLTIDPITGNGTAIGNIDYGQVRGLAYDASSATLYGTEFVTDQLLIIDTVSGVGTPVGYIGLDLLTGLALVPSPEETYFCEGFFSPFDKALVINKKAKGTIPVKIRLTDEFGTILTDNDIVTAPVINVNFNGMTYGDVNSDDAALDSVGASNEGNSFFFNEAEQLWEYRLGTKQFSSSGTYVVNILSGDQDEYVIDAGNDPACTQTFTRNQ